LKWDPFGADSENASVSHMLHGTAIFVHPFPLQVFAVFHRPHVGKYSIHGAYGHGEFQGFPLKKYGEFVATSIATGRLILGEVGKYPYLESKWDPLVVFGWILGLVFLGFDSTFKNRGPIGAPGIYF